MSQEPNENDIQNINQLLSKILLALKELDSKVDLNTDQIRGVSARVDNLNYRSVDLLEKLFGETNKKEELAEEADDEDEEFLDEDELDVSTDTKREPNAAFMKPLMPSVQLAKIVGNKPLPRTQIVKKLWAYIKKHGLQDKKNRRNINADAKLKAVFGKSVVNMLEMTKLVSKHLR